MKRLNGTGSVYQRKDGVWIAAYLQHDGRRRWIYAPSKLAASERLIEAQANAMKGVAMPARKETLGHFLQRWITEVAPLRVRPTTLRDYRGSIEHYLIPGLGKLRLHEVSPLKVQAFLNQLTAKGHKPDTLAHVRNVLRVALGQAQREELINQNAAKLVLIPRPEREEIPALDPDVARELIAAFRGHEYEALVILCLATGLRQGEALGLAWMDIDLQTGVVSVRRQLQRIDHEYRLVDLKTRKSRRTLSVPGIALEALRIHRIRQAEARLLAGPVWQETGRIFTRPDGYYLNGTTVTHRFQQRLAEAGLNELKFHHLRHGAASLLLAQGASMRTVMEQLGHSQIGLTMNTYAHIAPQLMQDAADRMQAALGGS